LKKIQIVIVTFGVFATGCLSIAAINNSEVTNAKQVYGQLPLWFVRSPEGTQGIRFESRGPGYTIVLTPGGPSYVFEAAKGRHSAAGLLLRVPNARETARMEGLDEQPGKVDYLVGSDPSKWRTNLTTWGKVAYRGVLPGVDLVFHGNAGRLEYDFEVAPNADPSTISIAASGAGWKTHLEPGGAILYESADARVRFDRPDAYQLTAAGSRRTVDSAYEARPGGAIGFRLGSYDRSLPLVIDPIAVMVYSTLVGGSGSETGNAIAIDRFGNAYVTGATTSLNFPTLHAVDSICGGTAGCSTTSDVFVTKFNLNGTGIIYSTYIGGSSSDVGLGIAVDNTGAAYITGSTTSSDFPVTSGAPQKTCGPAFQINAQTCAQIPVSTCGGGQSPSDAFVTKLNGAGSGIVWSTYLGGSGNDVSSAIAVNSKHEVFITGATDSIQSASACPNNNTPVVTAVPYPTTSMAFSGGTSATGGPGIRHAILTKLAANGSLAYSTYLGAGSTAGAAITLDGNNNAYVTGSTTDPAFPVTGGAYQTECASCPSQSDAFVAKLNPAASGAASLSWATYLGGPGADVGQAIALSLLGDVYVAGATASNPGFPTTAGVLQPVSPKPAGSPLPSAFVTRLNSAGSQAVFSTYLGGSDGSDYAYGLAVDRGGVEFIYGFSSSSDFPLVHPTFPEPAGRWAPYVVRMNAKGAALLPAEFVNAPSAAYQPGGGMAFDQGGNAYIVGTIGLTPGTPFVTTTNVAGYVPTGDTYYQMGNPAFENPASAQFGGATGNTHAFIQKMAVTAVVYTPSKLGFTPVTQQAVGTASAPLATTIFNPGLAHLRISSILITGTNAGDFTQTNNCLPYVVQLGTCTVSVTFKPSAPGYRTALLQVRDSQPGPQYVELSGYGQ
jgi:hypothetical protein